MAKISLREKLAAITMLALEFTGINVQKDKDGKDIAILTLAEPIPYVRGSQEVVYEGQTYPVTASDVTEIKVHEDDFNEDFSFDDGSDTGSYKGSELTLDVAKSTKSVWLRKNSFASAGNEMRSKFRNERLGKLVASLKPSGKATETPRKLQPVDEN